MIFYIKGDGQNNELHEVVDYIEKKQAESDLFSAFNGIKKYVTMTMREHDGETLLCIGIPIASNDRSKAPDMKVYIINMNSLKYKTGLSHLTDH